MEIPREVYSEDRKQRTEYGYEIKQKTEDSIFRIFCNLSSVFSNQSSDYNPVETTR